MICMISCVTSRFHITREPQSDYLASASNVKPLNFKTLRKIVEKNRLSKVEDLLSVLSQNYPGYLSYHTFMYDSQSIQSSSYQFPRAIVFGPQAKFIFTFNSKVDSSSTGSDGIETIEFNQDSSSFELHEIRFRDDSDDKTDFNGRPYLVSEPNPGKCLGCHSSDTENHWLEAANGIRYNPFIHPNWDEYFVWRGAYGSADDDRPPPPAGHGLMFKDGKSKELTEKEIFFDKGGNRFQGRYRYLPKASDMDGANSFLTSALAKENFDRIGKRLAINEIKTLRYSILAFSACDSTHLSEIITGLPIGLQSLIVPNMVKYKREYVGELNQLMSSIVFSEGRKLSELNDMYRPPSGSMSEEELSSSFNPAAFPISPAMTIAQFYGVATSDWALKATINGRGFLYGTDHMNFFTGALIRSLFSRQEQSELAPLAPENADYVDPKLCDLSIARGAR